MKKARPQAALGLAAVRAGVGPRQTGGSVRVPVPGQDLSVRSGQAYYSSEVRDHGGQAGEKKTLESQQNEGAQMSSELESDGAMVVHEFGI